MAISRDIKRHEIFHRAKILKHNLYRCPRDSRLHRLRVQKHDGYWQVSDRSDTIAIAVLARWKRYRKKGIAGFCAELAGDYGENAHFTIEPSMLVIDIGANIGEFSLHCLKRGARVVAIEADRRVYSVLERNLQGHENASTHNLAIAAENGTMTFYSSIQGADSSLVRPDVVDEDYQIRAATLSTLLDELGLDRVDLLKCDAEGAEPEVIRGALGAIRRIHRIAIDCGAERGGEATDAVVTSMLEEAGFDVRIGDAHPKKRVVWATNRDFRPGTTEG